MSENGTCESCAENKEALASRALRAQVAIVPYGRETQASLPVSMTSSEILANMVEQAGSGDGNPTSPEPEAPSEPPRNIQPFPNSPASATMPAPLAQMLMPRAAKHLLLTLSDSLNRRSVGDLGVQIASYRPKPFVPPAILPPSLPLPPNATDEEIEEFLRLVIRLMRLNAPKSMPAKTTNAPAGLRVKPANVSPDRWLGNIREADKIKECDKTHYGFAFKTVTHCISEVLGYDSLDREPDSKWYNDKSNELRRIYGRPGAANSFKNIINTSDLPESCRSDVEASLANEAESKALCPVNCQRAEVVLLDYYTSVSTVEDPDTLQGIDCQHFGLGKIYKDPRSKKWFVYWYVCWWVTIDWGMQFSITCRGQGF